VPGLLIFPKSQVLFKNVETISHPESAVADEGSSIVNLIRKGFTAVDSSFHSE